MTELVTGHIYQITCSTNPDFCYVGSTYLSIKDRWKAHRRCWNRWKRRKEAGCTCYPYFTKHGIENFAISILKSYTVCRTQKNDRKHLEAFESLWISKKKCVNKVIPVDLGRTLLKQGRLRTLKDELAEWRRDVCAGLSN